MGVCINYSYLYTQMSEDIHEIKQSIKKCVANKNPKPKRNGVNPS